MNLEAFLETGATPAAYLPPGAVSTNTLSTKRWSSRGYISAAADAPAFALYEARILGEVELRQSVFDRIGAAGRVALALSEIDLANYDRALDDLIQRGLADGRNVALRVAAYTDQGQIHGGTPLSSASLVWTGRVAGWPSRGRQARVALADISELLGLQLQLVRYSGAGGLGGSAALAGLPMPVSVGFRFNVTPVYIGDVDLGDGLKQTFQTNWREIVGHSAVRIRGVEQTPVTSAPTPGRYRDYPALGLFQLGGSADGDVTCDVYGDAPSGDYVNTTGGCIRRLVTALGPRYDAQLLDNTSWAEFETDVPGEIGWGIGAQDISTDAALAQILQGVAGWACGSRAGTLRLAALKSPLSTPAFILEEQDIISCEPIDMPRELSPSPNIVQVLSDANWTPLQNIAESVVPSMRARLAGIGTPALYFSDTVTRRVQQNRAWSLPGLYRDLAWAQSRAIALGAWLERGLRAFRIVTDRYRGQIELGYSGRVNYAPCGLVNWDGTALAWAEKLKRGRVELIMVG